MTNEPRESSKEPGDGGEAPRHLQLASRADLESAVIVLLRAACRIVRCAERDISRFGLSGRDAVELIERHALRLQPAATVRGDLWIEQASRAQPLIAAFDRRWDAAVHSLPTVPLGL
ncbi:MAG TPA: hypothetical protein VF229_05315 [Burkholderiaceae bacterium]